MKLVLYCLLLSLLSAAANAGDAVENEIAARLARVKEKRVELSKMSSSDRKTNLEENAVRLIEIQKRLRTAKLNESGGAMRSALSVNEREELLSEALDIIALIPEKSLSHAGSKKYFKALIGGAVGLAATFYVIHFMYADFMLAEQLTRAAYYQSYYNQELLSKWMDARGRSIFLENVMTVGGVSSVLFTLPITMIAVEMRKSENNDYTKWDPFFNTLEANGLKIAGPKHSRLKSLTDSFTAEFMPEVKTRVDSSVQEFKRVAHCRDIILEPKPMTVDEVEARMEEEFRAEEKAEAKISR